VTRSSLNGQQDGEQSGRGHRARYVDKRHRTPRLFLRRVISAGRIAFKWKGVETTDSETVRGR